MRDMDTNTVGAGPWQRWGGHKKQTRAAGLRLWDGAQSSCRERASRLGGARAVDVGPTWTPSPGVGVAKAGTLRGTRVKASL